MLVRWESFFFFTLWWSFSKSLFLFKTLSDSVSLFLSFYFSLSSVGKSSIFLFVLLMPHSAFPHCWLAVAVGKVPLLQWEIEKLTFFWPDILVFWFNLASSTTWTHISHLIKTPINRFIIACNCILNKNISFPPEKSSWLSIPSNSVIHLVTRCLVYGRWTLVHIIEGLFLAPFNLTLLQIYCHKKMYIRTFKTILASTILLYFSFIIIHFP